MSVRQAATTVLYAIYSDLGEVAPVWILDIVYSTVDYVAED